MKVLEKLKAIEALLTINPNYCLPNKLVEALINIAKEIGIEGYNHETIIDKNGEIKYRIIEPKDDNITTLQAVDVIINAPTINWNRKPSTTVKYLVVYLDELFEEITPIEWTKILGFINKGTN